MNQFDVIVVLLLAVSGLIGCLRGATREVMTVLAFILAVLAALFSLRLTGPPIRHWIHPAWLANSVAALVVFLIVYIGARLVGARVAHNVRHMDHLSLLDRVIGLGFGLARGVVLLGVFQLLFHEAVPAGQGPAWITRATLYPLAEDSANGLRTLAPQGSAVASQLAPTLEHAVAENADSAATSDQPAETSH